MSTDVIKADDVAIREHLIVERGMWLVDVLSGTSQAKTGASMQGAGT